MVIRKTTFEADLQLKEEEFLKLTGLERLKLVRLWNDRFRSFAPPTQKDESRVVRRK